MVRGSRVLFHSEIYVIQWIYESGFCEIQKDTEIILVKLSELTPFEEEI